MSQTHLVRPQGQSSFRLDLHRGSLEALNVKHGLDCQIFSVCFALISFSELVNGNMVHSLKQLFN